MHTVHVKLVGSMDILVLMFTVAYFISLRFILLIISFSFQSSSHVITANPYVTKYSVINKYLICLQNVYASHSKVKIL